MTLSTGTSSTSCAARHVLADTLRQVNEVRPEWVERGGIADAAYSKQTWTVVLQGRTGRASDPVQALREAWPTDRSPLPRVLHPPPYDLLLKACAGRIDEAYADAGAAVPLALARLGPPPDKAPAGPLLRRWAFARGLWSRGRIQEALPHLRAVNQGLEQGALGPTWRSKARFDEIPTVEIVGSTLILFEDGTFEARSLPTGTLRWSRRMGTAEPRPVPIDNDGLVFVLDDGLEAVDAATGQTRWRRALSDPRAEVESGLGLLYVADDDANRRASQQRRRTSMAVRAIEYPGRRAGQRGRTSGSAPRPDRRRAQSEYG